MAAAVVSTMLFPASSFAFEFPGDGLFLSGSSQAEETGQQGEGQDDEAEQRRQQQAVYYDQLAQVISSAETYLAQESNYTAESLAKLRESYTRASEMYEQAIAAPDEILNTCMEVMLRIVELAPKNPQQNNSADSKNVDGLQDAKQSNSSSSSSTQNNTSSGKLNISNLADGNYTIKLRVLKTDRKSTSMGDKGVSHTATLQAKKGKLTLVLRLKSVSVGTSSSYLSTMKYFVNSYTTNSSGVPKGKTAKAKVLSYQTDSSGKRYKDAYGSKYPKRISMPLISSAKKDGFVPLLVTVPIMNAISPGNGEQAMYLKLDLNSIVQKSSSSRSSSSDSGSSSGSSGSKSESQSQSSGSGGSGSGPSGLSDASGDSDAGSDEVLSEAGGADMLADEADLDDAESSEELDADAATGEGDAVTESTESATTATAVPVSYAAAASSTEQPPLRQYVPVLVLAVLIFAAGAAGSVLLHRRNRLGERR